MSHRYRFFIILGIALGLVPIRLVWQVTQDISPVPPVSSSRQALASSPLASPTTTGLMPFQSPLPAPPATTHPVTTATLDAIRTMRPTATPPSSSGIRLPYISPDTWRAWALRILGAAGVLAYIGLRLRRGQ